MPELPIGKTGGGIGGIPTKYVLIGAGVLGVGAILLMQRGSGGSGGDPANAAYSGSLGPNASLALGGVQNELLRQSGEIQAQLLDYFDDLDLTLGSQAAALGDQITSSTGQVLAGQGAWGGQLAGHQQQIEDLVRYFGWKMPGAIPDVIAFPDGFPAAQEASRAAQRQQY